MSEAIKKEDLDKLLDEGKFCPLPFLQLQLNPFGDISACCFSGEHKVGDIQTDSIKDIWNGSEIKKWRQEFLDGNIGICKNAIHDFQCHKQYKHLNQFVELKSHQDDLPRMLDVRLNGKCNLECVMCEVWKQPNQLYDKSDFWELGKSEIFPKLLEVMVLGGEPFIQKDTFRLIDEVSEVNDRVRWAFITNAHYKFNEKLKSSLDKIKINSIHISLDSIDPETYPKIRLRGRLSLVLETLDAFVNYKKSRIETDDRPIELFASMTFQRLNWREIPAFLEFCIEKGLIPIFQDVVERDHLNIRGLSNEEKDELRKGIEMYREGHFWEHLRAVRMALGEDGLP